MYIDTALTERKLPEIPSDRAVLLRTLANCEYGILPEAATADAKIFAEDKKAYAGKATEIGMKVFFDTPTGSFSFPLTVLIPNISETPRLFINLTFRSSVPDRYLPAEEIIDSGCAVAALCYTDITSDDGDFKNGLAAAYPRSGPQSCGKIGFWAYAAQRAADALIKLRRFDENKLAVIGHSRLGKTALWCAANDERFSLAVSNDSGCSGDALTRGKRGEHVREITDVFPFWFCKNYAAYAGRHESMPFDQHWLLAAVAPRLVFINSAENDSWADPESEFLCCAAAGKYYERRGLKGFIAEDRPPRVGDFYKDGSIGFAMRSGEHFLSRADWNAAISFWKSKE